MYRETVKGEKKFRRSHARVLAQTAIWLPVAFGLGFLRRVA